ncbi:MAG: hypothetical protein Q7S59_01015 [Sulfurimonas sp.]|nr:hypothetical protein [Sulfurimonas sp.]
MKLFLHVAILLSLCFSAVFADQFRDVQKISLKKDEQKKILVKYGSFEKIFKFRWTLYHNKGLVIFRSYDRIVAQNILYLRDKNQAFKVELKPKDASSYEGVYLLVQFKEFDYEKKQATFDISISDKSAQVNLKYLEK